MNNTNDVDIRYQPGEIRLGTRSPGPGWVRADGSLTYKQALVSRLNKAGYFGWRPTSMGLNHVRGLAYGNGVWVAGGDSGAFYTSTTGESWTFRVSRTFQVNNIVYSSAGAGKFVAVCNTGRIHSSTDGITWTTSTSNATTNLNGVVYGNGLYAAVGTAGVIRTSTDGTTWTTQTSNATTTLNSVAFGNGVFVAVGAGSTIRTSTDAVTWVTRKVSLFSAEIRDVAFGNGLFAAIFSAGQSPVLTSTDGVTWRTAPVIGDSGGYCITYANNMWVVGHTISTQISASTDLVRWVTQASLATSTTWEVAYGNGVWLATSFNGFVQFAQAGAARLPRIIMGAEVYGWLRV